MSDRNLLSLIGPIISLGAGVKDSTSLDLRTVKPAVGAGGVVLGMFMTPQNAFIPPGTTGTDRIKLQHSNDNSTWVDVPARNVNWAFSRETNVAAGEHNRENDVALSDVYGTGAVSGHYGMLGQYNGGRRYVRIQLTGNSAASEAIASFAIVRRKYRADAASR